MKTKIYIMHSTHLDLFWMGAQDRCLDWGSQILDDVIRYALEDKNFCFMIENVRFVEYYLHLRPEKKQTILELVHMGQLEFGADYIDKLENPHDGESLVRNILHGKRLLKKLLGLDTVLSFHPDLPGTAEQTPQIFRKCGIRYYLTARGFKHGARFNWNGLDGKGIIYYNFPVHYSYYTIENDLLPYLEMIQAAVASKNIAISCSAGDLGAADTFTDKGERVNLRKLIARLNKTHTELDFKMSAILPVLKSLDASSLATKDGENPSRWGHTCSALHIQMCMLDKEVSANLMDAEKYSAICNMLSIPIKNIQFERHVLAHDGVSGGIRRYFELEKKVPTTNNEYLTAAWEYQLITQDHNHGGVEGSQAEFDRFIYKNGALTIARRIRDDALANIATLIKNNEPSVAVFNSMNWSRGGEVKLPAGILLVSSYKSYVAVDEAGCHAPIICRDGEFIFEATNVPSIGYKCYHIKEEPHSEAPVISVLSKENGLLLTNRFYEMALCQKTGVVKRIYDKDCRHEVVMGDRFLSIGAYEDLSVSAADTNPDKPLVDESVRHVRKVGVKYSDAYETCVEVVTELLNNKIVYEIVLPKYKKEIRVSSTLYWCPTIDMQIKMNLDLPFCPEQLVYGVPYGTQVYGKVLEEDVTFKNDEISGILYSQYREVEKWFAAENNGFGVSIASNVGAYDFNGRKISNTMMRNVKSVGDYSFQFVNKGVFRFNYIISSYSGSWEDNVYRRGWELAQPLSVVSVPQDNKGILPAEQSFLCTGGKGILTVLAKAEDDDGYITRIFNPTPRSEKLEWDTPVDIAPRSVVDLRQQDLGEPLDILEPYEIKTVRFG